VKPKIAGEQDSICLKQFVLRFMCRPTQVVGLFLLKALGGSNSCRHVPDGNFLIRLLPFYFIFPAY